MPVKINTLTGWVVRPFGPVLCAERLRELEVALPQAQPKPQSVSSASTISSASLTSYSSLSLCSSGSGAIAPARAPPADKGRGLWLCLCYSLLCVFFSCTVQVLRVRDIACQTVRFSTKDKWVQVQPEKKDLWPMPANASRKRQRSVAHLGRTFLAFWHSVAQIISKVRPDKDQIEGGCHEFSSFIFFFFPTGWASKQPFQFLWPKASFRTEPIQACRDLCSPWGPGPPPCSPPCGAAACQPICGPVPPPVILTLTLIFAVCSDWGGVSFPFAPFPATEILLLNLNLKVNPSLTLPVRHGVARLNCCFTESDRLNSLPHQLILLWPKKACYQLVQKVGHQLVLEKSWPIVSEMAVGALSLPRMGGGAIAGPLVCPGTALDQKSRPPTCAGKNLAGIAVGPLSLPRRGGGHCSIACLPKKCFGPKKWVINLCLKKVGQPFLSPGWGGGGHCCTACLSEKCFGPKKWVINLCWKKVGRMCRKLLWVPFPSPGWGGVAIVVPLVCPKSALAQKTTKANQLTPGKTWCVFSQLAFGVFPRPYRG
jgi:hypothetical protein